MSRLWKRKGMKMNETEANGVGNYKLKRSGEPTGFMKRFRETPPVIFGTDPNEFERRWIAYTETYLYTIREAVTRHSGIDRQRMSRCLESGLVEHCICGKGKVRGLTAEQVRCWKLRRIE